MIHNSVYKILLSAFFTATLVLISAASWAEPVTINNHSFEEDVLSDGTWNADFITGWVIEAYPGTVGSQNLTTSQTGCGSPDVFINGIPDGVQTHWSNNGYISQQTGTIITAGHRYTLTVGVGSRCDHGRVRYAIRLLAGNTQLAATTGTSPRGGWTEATVTYYSPTGDSNVGKPLTIRMDNRTGTQLNLDDVRLDDSMVSEAENFATGSTLKSLLFGNISIPGLDSLPISALQSGDGFKSAIVTLHGQSMTIVSFTANSHKIIAVIPNNFSLSDFVPLPSGTPLDNVTFSDMAFIIAQANISLAKADAPVLLSAALSHGGDTVTLKQGVNLFGQANFSAPGTVKDLLSNVGITALTLPLNGSLPTNLFSQNPKTAAQAFKNQILDNLDITLPLPTPSISGLSALTFNNGKMHILGTMPDGSHGISVEVSGDADVHFGSDTVDFAVDVTYDRASGGKKKELKITGTTTTPWNNPFGMSWIDLTNLSVSFDEKTTNGQKEWNVAVNAKSTIGHHSNLDVTVNVTEENGALTDATFTLDGPLDLSEVPGLKDIPEVNDLTINKLTASSHGIEAKTTFQSNETDFFAFENNDKWVIALSQDNFKITEIIPPLASTPLKHIVLSEASILYADAALNGTMSSFGPIAQAAFKRIYGDGVDATIQVDEGLNIIAAFEHSRSTGTSSCNLTKGFTRLGMSQERIILVGDIGGIMGDSNPHVNLQATLDAHGSPSHMPSWLSFASDATFVFSLFASDVGDDPVVEFGIGVDVTATVHDDTLIFDSKLAMEIQEENIDIKFVMDLKTGNKSDGLSASGGLNCTLTKSPTHSAPEGPAGWHKPFGIPGFTLYNVAMDVGIDEDGSIHLGFAGGAKIGEDRFCVAADADLTAAEGIPQDIAFIGAADKVGMLFPQNLALQIVADLLGKNDISIPISHLPAPEFKNVKFAFVTPGASDPDLNIQGEGVAMKGTLYWLGKTLGSVDIAVGPNTGIKIDGTIGEPKPDGTAGDLKIGPLTFKNTSLDFKIPIPPKDPLSGYFKLNADMEIPIIGFNDAIEVDLTSEGMSFSITQTLLSDFSETITLALKGVTLSLTHPDMSKADFAISGALKADFGAFIKTALDNTMTALFSELGQTLRAGEAAVKAAKTTVEGLNTQINEARAVVRAEKARVEAKLETAQARVDTIKTDITHDWNKYHGCASWKVWCKVRWGITIGVEKGVKDVADLVLEAIEDLVSHFPIDFDPRVALLIAAKYAAEGVLDLALAGIEGLDDLDNLATKGLRKIANFAGGSVNLINASFNGDLKEVLNNDAPVDLNIDIELFGTEFNETFAFRLGDAANELSNLGKKGAADAAHLAILAYVAADHLFHKVLSDIPKPFRMQLSRSIGTKIHTTQTALKAELKNYKNDFLQYHKTAQALQVDYSNFGDSYSSTLMQKRVTMLDKEPASKTFTDAQFELGVTGICLSGGDSEEYQSGGSRIFNGCAAKDEQYSVSYTAQKISTEAMLYTSGKNKGKPTGYVKIKGQDLYGDKKCLTVPGKWKFEEVTYDKKIIEQEVFHPYTKYGKPVFVYMAGQCNDDPQFQWKILPHGDGYFQIHNRATQTCIWMKSTNDGYGDYTNDMEMIPCAGAKTGVFRIAEAVPAVLHSVGLPLKRGYVLKSKDGQSAQLTDECFGTTGWGSCDKPASNDSTGYDTFDYFEDNLGRRRYISKKNPGDCLIGNYRSELGGNVFYFDYLECDSKSSSQWLKTSLVVGGLTLADPTGDFSQHKITWNDRFPDPKEILYQPLNPRAGVKWSDNMSYNYTNSGMNVAYTKARQTTTAINARANAWKAIKSKLAAMSTDLAAGKQVCMKSGKVSLCYRLGMQTGYVAKKVPAGSKTQHQLTDGTPIITDDVSDALENKLANIAPMKEPKWFICSTKKIIDQWHSQIMHLPGVVANQYCISSEGSKQYNGYWRAPEINVITDGTDVFWQPAGNGYLPSSAVITGRIKLNTATGAFDATNQKTGQLTGSTVAMFSCRAMVGRKTKIGWTIGGKYCHILKFAGGAVVENFEVLTVNGSIAAPPPPPSPAASCTYQMVHNYYNGIQPSCTADQYNKEHPDCHFMSRHNGSCDGGPPPDDN